MKKFLLITFFTFGLGLLNLNAQSIYESFNYTDGALVGQGSWTQTGTIATNPIQLSTNTLIYTNYFPAGIKMVTLGTGQDVYKALTPGVSSGALYASFLLNISAASSAGDYFFHFGDGSTSNFFAKLFATSLVGGGYVIGISKGGSGSTTVNGPNTYVFGTTYLVVVKYTFNAVSATDDVSSVFVNPDISAGSTDNGLIASTSVGSDATVTLSSVNLRQGGSTTYPSVTLTSMKIGTTWSNSVLPISLTTFTGKPFDKSVLLNWNTASEENNDFFDVQHSADGKTFSSIGKISGAGTSKVSKEYSFTDDNPFAGTNYYKLVQHDYDGKTSASNTIAVDSKIAASQLSVYAGSSDVKITLSSPNKTKGLLQLFDISGRKLAENSVEVNKGYNNFSLPVSLQAGVHFVRYISESESVNIKFVR